MDTPTSTPEAVTDLRSLLARARNKTVAATFTRNGISLACTLQAVNKRDLDGYAKVAFRKEWDKQAKSWERIPDDEEFRKFCARCVVGWKGLTVGQAYELSALEAEAPLAPEEAARTVAYTADGATMLCETVIGFADWVFAQVVQTAQQIADREADLKNG